ncbi:MAG: NAD(+)--rifampin ADP-ribosyltransferase [Prolixibacteraceae bacterium]|nr:NAD(+)--rifampin ADP-ribosyltransferase [Prolixibacteraceae bacterium]
MNFIRFFGSTFTFSFQGNPTKSYRSKHPFKVVGEVAVCKDIQQPLIKQ